MGREYVDNGRQDAERRIITNTEYYQWKCSTCAFAIDCENEKGDCDSNIHAFEELPTFKHQETLERQKGVSRGIELALLDMEEQFSVYKKYAYESMPRMDEDLICNALDKIYERVKKGLM